MTIRILEPKDWAVIAPIFAEQGGKLPKNVTAAVAFDENGALAGFWTLQPCWHAGPLWVRPDLRGTGLWRKLHAFLDGLFLKMAGTGYYSFSGELKTDKIFVELGYKDLGYKVYAKEVK